MRASVAVSDRRRGSKPILFARARPTAVAAEIIWENWLRGGRKNKWGEGGRESAVAAVGFYGLSLRLPSSTERKRERGQLRSHSLSSLFFPLSKFLPCPSCACARWCPSLSYLPPLGEGRTPHPPIQSNWRALQRRLIARLTGQPPSPNHTAPALSFSRARRRHRRGLRRKYL